MNAGGRATSCYVHQQMNTYRSRLNAQACGAQVASEASTQPQYQQIKLAMDVHAASIVVSRLLEGAKPQPPQTFKPADFLAWAKKQVTLAKEVISCYEAGPTGFWLHRKLTALGVRNYVVCPTRLDERHCGVASDRTDALELATRLDRYVAGNDRALADPSRRSFSVGGWCGCPPRRRNKSGRTNASASNCGSSV